MKDKILKIFSSNIKIKVTGKNINNFLKRLIYNNINIIKVVNISYKEADLIINYQDLEKINKYKTIYNIEVIEYQGKLKLLKLIKKNIFIISFLILSLIIIYILSNVIFSVEVIHSNSSIIKLLEKELNYYGIKKYSFVKSYNEIEEKLERTFGPNLNDADYLIEARKIIEKDSIIMNITETLIDKLYKVKDREIFKKVKEKNENVKVIIATNHLSFVRNFIGETFNIDYLDDLIISAEIHKIKPNSDFYEYILNKYNIDSKELLFLDDNIDNVNGAKQLGINTIKVEKNTNLIEEIGKFI